MLGDSYRHGVIWPNCGELDIMERKNGEMVGHGTPHCDVDGENRCGWETRHVELTEPVGEWHTWAMDVDRTDADWMRQKVVWMLDGRVYNEVTGETIGNEATWKTLAHSPLFFIVNVAVGGRW